jgi:hypothetical protein
MKYVKKFDEGTNYGVSRNADIDDIFQELLDDFGNLEFEKIYIRATKCIVYRSKFTTTDRKFLGKYHHQIIPYLEEINDRLEDIGLRCYLLIGGEYSKYYINIRVVEIEPKIVNEKLSKYHFKDEFVSEILSIRYILEDDGYELLYSEGKRNVFLKLRPNIDEHIQISVKNNIPNYDQGWAFKKHEFLTKLHNTETYQEFTDRLQEICDNNGYKLIKRPDFTLFEIELK